MNARNKEPLLTRIPIVLVALIALSYTAYRACVMSFTHDESLTYLMLKLFGIKVLHIEHVQNVTYLNLRLDRITHVFNANNHLLNTALMKLSSVVFGEREWALRLPALVAHVGYIVFSYRLLRLRQTGPLLVCGFILLNLNPFVLDFFSIARGYGLAISLMLISLYYFIVAKNYRDYVRAYLVCFLAVYANFTLFNFYLCLLACHLLIAFRRQERFDPAGLWRRLWRRPGFIVLQGGFFGITAVLLVALSKGNQLYVGSRSVPAALHSLSFSGLYENPRLLPLASVSAMLVAVCLIGIAAMLGTEWRRRETGPGFIAGFLLIGCAGISVSEFLLAHVPLPAGRTGLYLFPLFYLSLVFLLGSDLTGKLRSARGFVLPALALCAVLNFWVNANGASVLYMPYDAYTKQAYERIAADAAGKDAEIYADWSFEPALNYYRVSRRQPNIHPVLKQGVFTVLQPDSVAGANYLYLYKDQVKNALPGASVLADFPDTKTVLLKR